MRNHGGQNVIPQWLPVLEMARADFFQARTAHGPEPLAQKL